MKLRMLIIDDNARMLKYMGKFFEEQDFSVRSFNSGKVALSEVRMGLNYDIVIVDRSLNGEMDGDQITEELKRIFPDRPVIITSAYSNLNQNTKADEYLQKGRESQEIVNAVNKLLHLEG